VFPLICEEELLHIPLLRMNISRISRSIVDVDDDDDGNDDDDEVSFHVDGKNMTQLRS